MSAPEEGCEDLSGGEREGPRALVGHNVPEMALRPCSLLGCVFGVWGNSGVLPKNPPLTTNANGADTQDQQR